MATRIADNAVTTLDGGITDVATTLDVVSASAFPTSGDFYIGVGDPAGTYEVMLVTGVSSATFTVTRAQAGTSASAHSTGVQVAAVLTAGALDGLRSDAGQIGAYASLPATSAVRAGYVYEFTDSPIDFARFDGSAWKYYCRPEGGGLIEVTPPPTTGWSWEANSGTSSISTLAGAQRLVAQAGTGLEHRLRLRSLPSSPYLIEFGLTLTTANRASNASTAVAVLRDSSGTAFISFPGVTRDHAAGLYFSNDWNSYNSFASDNHATADLREAYGQKRYFIQIEDDATDRICRVFDCGEWRELFREGRTTFITPDQFGFGANPRNSDAMIVKLFHYSET